MKTQIEYQIFINGNLTIAVPSKEDAMWHLGAKFGGNKYNEMVDDNKIIYNESSVYVSTKL